jgi:UDP-N-acetylmuramoyl-tripeptide--D-alanyl-D-alanine ligase
VSLWTSAEIAEATGGTASQEFEVDGVAFDSREVGPGDLFVAMQGEVTDGHRFLDGAFAQGAAGAIVSGPCDGPHVRVADGFAALQALGRAGRDRSAAKVVGVTGSVGKTSAKEALWAALERSNHDHVHRSVKSYNNHTGVPLSLARMLRDAAFGVFEMGMNHAGEIAALTRMVRPHVAVITTVASVHLEFFESEAGIADAKAEIFEGLAPGGTAIIPFDNVHRDRLIAAAERHGARVVTFGTGGGADVRTLEAVRVASGGTFVTAKTLTKELSFTIDQPGAHHVVNSLAVLAAVEAVGADLAQAGLALAEAGGLPGRGARIEVRLPGGGSALILDESYNANPTSMRATLSVLGQERAARRIAILGAMGELGPDADRFHAELAEPVLAANVEAALLVGEAMEPLARALEGKVNIVHVPDTATALERVHDLIGPGDAVLVKGSNGVGLSRLVAGLSGG